MKYIYVCLLLITSTSLSGQSFQEMTDSLIALVPSAEDNITRIDLLNEISYSYRRIAGDKVLEYANVALSEAKEANYIKGQAIALKNKGIAHIKLSSPHDTAIYYHQQSIILAQQCKDYYTEAACNNNIAISYTRSNRISTGIKHYLKGIEIFDRHIDEETRLKALMLANVAENFFYLEEYGKALDYIKRAYQLAEKNNYRSIVSIYANDYGKILTQIGRIKEARDIFEQGLIVSQELDDKVSIAYNLGHLANLELNEGNTELAESYAKQIYEQPNRSSIQDAKAMSQIVLAKIAKDQKNMEDAIAFCESILAENSDRDFIIYQQEARLLASSCYEEQGENGKALFYLKEYYDTDRKTRSSEKARVFAELEAKYQIRDKESEIAFLSKEKEIRDSYINWLILFCSLALFASIFAGVLLSRNIKNNKIIEGKNEELEKYIESHLQLENFAYIASHDLRTPLRSIISFSQILKKRLGEQVAANDLEYFDFIIQGTKEMSTIINDLFEYAKINSQETKRSVVQVDEVIEHIISKNQVLLDERETEITTDLEIRVIEADEQKMNQVFQHLILNAVKFRNPQEAPKIHISSWLENGEAIFKVKDNGIGIDKSYHEKIFMIFKRLHQKTEYNGSGIGLAICKKVMELHGGRIWVESTLNKGSEFYFTIPFKKNPLSERRNKMTSVKHKFTKLVKV